MNTENHSQPSLLLRTALILAMIAFGAALRIAPHPWNFTPVGAMALFSGAMLKDRRLAVFFPLLSLFAGDIFVGFHKLMPIVYASFLVSVALGMCLRRRRTVPRIAALTFVGSLQFFLVTNFGVWALLGGFPDTVAGLGACYLAGLPFFWNTLAGDALYVLLFFGAFAVAEHSSPALREHVDGSLAN